MTWIKVIPISQAEGKLKEAFERQRSMYPPEYAVQVPELPVKDSGGIVPAHSLIPDAMEHAFSTFGALMSPDLPLSRREQELIATAVSITNRTRYCSLSHLEFLRIVTKDDELTKAFKTDPLSAPLTDSEKVIVEYAIQITKDATKIDKSWHDRLRSIGYDDVGILQITMIAAWFNYINRMADALGVGRE